MFGEPEFGRQTCPALSWLSCWERSPPQHYFAGWYRRFLRRPRRF